MTFIKEHKNQIAVGLFTVFIFSLFAYITYLTPLAGDDWGYAVTGRENNPFVAAFEFYFAWSGRFFSELWGFVVAPNKWLWNILNPLMFAGIFLLIINLFDKHKILFSTIVAGLILSVQNTLRIETYTWIMGSTYVVPLFLMLIYINIIKKVIYSKKSLNNKLLIFSVLLNFYITLCMENIAGVLVLFNILIMIYSFQRRKELLKPFGLILAVSIIGILILRMSPGARYRLENDNVEFNSLSLFEKIGVNYLTFLDLTFVKNVYLFFTLSASLTLFNIKNYSNKKDLIFILYYFLGMFIALSGLIYSKLNLNFLKVFFDVYYSRSCIIFLSFYYLFYIIGIFISLSNLDEKEYLESITYLMLAGSSNLVMMISPIFGARSSLYTVYFIILLIGSIIAKMPINKKEYFIVVVLYLALIGLKTREYLYKYRLVNYYMQIRNMQIEYYVNNPNEKEAWLIKMPKYYIHSADIEQWDTYHLETFKEYYGINPKMKVIFYEDKGE